MKTISQKTFSTQFLAFQACKIAKAAMIHVCAEINVDKIVWWIVIDVPLFSFLNTDAPGHLLSLTESKLSKLIML